MTFAVFCFMVLWVLLIIEGLNYEIIVLCSLVAISLTILSNFIIFIFEGKKTPSKLSFWERHFHFKKNLRLQDFASRFSKYFWGADPPS
jgi:cell division protein FtsW (lipid II flippase)